MKDTYVRSCRLLPMGGDFFCGAPAGEYEVCRKQGFGQKFALRCPYVLVKASRLVWWIYAKKTDEEEEALAAGEPTGEPRAGATG